MERSGTQDFREVREGLGTSLSSIPASPWLLSTPSSEALLSLSLPCPQSTLGHIMTRTHGRRSLLYK